MSPDVTAPGCTPACRRVYISSGSVGIGSPMRRTTALAPFGPGLRSLRLTMLSSRNGSTVLFPPSSSRPGIGLP